MIGRQRLGLVTMSGRELRRIAAAKRYAEGPAQSQARALRKFTQKQLITFTAKMQTSLIGMEACSGAHFLGRVLREQGHDVKLIPAQFVKSNKNDFLECHIAMTGLLSLQHKKNHRRKLKTPLPP